jgi:hypothetical protein
MFSDWLLKGRAAAVRYGDWLRVVRSRIDFRHDQEDKDWSGVHPASCSTSKGTIFSSVRRPKLETDKQLRLVPRLKCVEVCLHAPYAFTALCLNKHRNSLPFDILTIKVKSTLRLKKGIPFNRVGCKVLMVESMKMAVFWIVALCRLVEVYRRFRGTYAPSVNSYQTTRHCNPKDSHLQTLPSPMS